MSLLELFCAVDDFCEAFEPRWQQQLLTAGECRRRRSSGLCLSEVMTLVIHFHQSRYRDFKSYYQSYVHVYLRQAFPELVSYGRLCLEPSTCAAALAGAPASRLSIRRHWLSVALSAFTNTRSF